MEIRRAGPGEIKEIARLHALCFEERWTADAFAALLAQPKTFALLANETQEEEVRGFVVVRIAADESEILTIGTAPEHRCRGIASRLVLAAAELAESEGAVSCFLETGLENLTARRLYHKLGFVQVGIRERYYQRRTLPADDACLLKAQLPLCSAHRKVK